MNILMIVFVILGILKKSLSTIIIYFTIFAISLLFARIYEKKEKKLNQNKRIILLVLMALPLIMLATIRYNVGTDYMAYIKNCANISDSFSLKLIFIHYTKEPLYVISTFIGSYLFNSFTGAMYLYSIIFMFFIISGIIYYRDKIYISISLIIFCLGYYLLFFNITRQMIAVAILFFASRYLYEKKLFKYAGDL